MRIAVIGSSHVGAIKDALPQINAAFPEVRLSFFAVPGGAFRKCVLRGGVLRAKPASDAEARLIIDINGETSIDVNDCKHLWVIGHRFSYGAVLQAWLAGQNPQAQMETLVHDSFERIKQQFGDEPRLTLTPAPYPALRARAPGPNQELRMMQMQRHPDRDQIFAAYNAVLHQTAKSCDYTLLTQPDETLGAPFATANNFLTDARSSQTGEPIAGDLRHMNAAYGLAAFRHYARHRLGL